jgi:hypothetical protein
MGKRLVWLPEWGMKSFRSGGCNEWYLFKRGDSYWRKRFGGGRVAEKAATGITEQLVELGFESDRLKTGTLLRVDGRSLDYSKWKSRKVMRKL